MNERIEKLKTFLGQSPDDCFLNHALALEYVKLHADTEAEKLFEKNKTNDPGYVATYYHLGKLLERIGKNDEAVSMYEEGMKAAKNVNDQHSYNELQGAYEDLVY
jgi:tetratricopeptide (TPR) repeat protein